MYRFTKWIAAPAMAFGLMFAGDASLAKAQHGHCGYGYGGGYSSGIGISIGGGGYRSFGSPYYGGIYSSHYGQRGGFYHDTSHYDYHPTTILRHGSHFHVQPGHYDFHRTGHYHP